MTFRQGTTAVIIPSASIDLNRENRVRRSPSRSRIARRFRHVAASVAGIWSALALAQEMEPRTYSAVPVGTNFVVADYARSSGDITFDPSLPVTGLQATINNYSLGYSHSFGMLGHVASIAVSVPYANANVTGNVEGEPITFSNDASDQSEATNKQRATACIIVLQSFNGEKGDGCPVASAPNFKTQQDTGIWSDQIIVE